jgi:hypothetical protein
MKKLVSGAAILLVLATAAMPARATTDRLTPWLFLARVSVNEAGWDSYQTGDMIMIHETFVRGAARQGVPYLSYATHYSQRVAGIRPTSSGRIAWTMNLRSDGAEPSGWPRQIMRRLPDGTTALDPHPAWSNFRAAWLETVERAREVSSWTFDTIENWSVCSNEAHDWGSPRLDRARAERLGLAEVVCEAAPGTQAVSLTVTDRWDGRRLDRALTGLWDSSTMPLGNATAERWIRIGRVTVGGEVVSDRTARVAEGQEIVIRPAPRNDSWSRPWLLPPTTFEDINEDAPEPVDVD